MTHYETNNYDRRTAAGDFFVIYTDIATFRRWFPTSSLGFPAKSATWQRRSTHPYANGRRAALLRTTHRSGHAVAFPHPPRPARSTHNRQTSAHMFRPRHTSRVPCFSGRVTACRLRKLLAVARDLPATDAVSEGCPYGSHTRADECETVLAHHWSIEPTAHVMLP